MNRKPRLRRVIPCPYCAAGSNVESLTEISAHVSSVVNGGRAGFRRDRCQEVEILALGNVIKLQVETLDPNAPDLYTPGQKLRLIIAKN